MKIKYLAQSMLLSSIGLLSACGGGGSEPATQVSEFMMAYDHFSQLSDAEKYQEIGQLEIASQRSLMAWTGLETELGGSAATDVALNDVALGMAAMAEAEVANLDTQIQQNFVTPISKTIQPYNVYKSNNDQVIMATGDQVASAFLGLGMSFMQGYMVTSMGTYSDGSTINSSFGQSSGSQDGSANVAIDQATTNFNSELNTVINGMDVKSKTIVEMNQCPDVDGNVSLHLVSESRIVKQNTNIGTNTSFDITMSTQFDDNAKFDDKSVKYMMREQLAAFDSGKGTFIDVTWKNNSENVNRASSQATNTDLGVAKELGKTAYILALSILMKSQDAVDSGRCVRLDVTTDDANRTDLDPSTPFQITASPRSKIDGSFVGGTVKATLNGGSALNPANTPVIADGVFSYVGPDAYGQTATVNLEARSKRGVGKESVTFSTKKADAYISTFDYSLVGGAVTATADVTWTLVPGAGDAIDTGAKYYKPSGTVNATFSYTGCTPITKVLNVDENDTNSLILYSPASATYPSKYVFNFSAGLSPASTSVFTCGSNTIEMPTYISVAGTSCDAKITYAYTTLSGFQDQFSCNYINYSWIFTRQ